MTRCLGGRVLVVLVGVAVFGLVGAPPAHAVDHVWEVNTTDDTNDGDCEFVCSLRDAVMEANASAGDDLIVLPGGHYLLTIGGFDNAASAGDLDITDTAGQVTIAGPGIIDGNGLDRVFHVFADAQLELRDVTITGGDPIDIGGGGGVFTDGSLTVVDSIITGNSESGIASWEGTVMVIESTITGNTVNGGGGAINNWLGRAVTVIDSVITNNTAFGGGGISSNTNGSGAPGIGSVVVIDSTITNNTAPVGPDCYGVVDTLGVVVVGDASDCTLTPVHVDHTTGESAGVEVVARLESDINPQLIFENSSTGVEWFHAMTSDGEFKISRNGTNTVEAKFFSSGDLVLAGALTQGSDVNEKTGIVPVDPVVVLERVRDLEVSSWSYAASPGVSHVGPMAQDFYASFGVGADPTGIAAVDADGVALAAIQALADENARLADDVRTLQLLLAGLGLAGVVVAIGKWRSGRGFRLAGRSSGVGGRVLVVLVGVAMVGLFGVVGAPPAHAVDHVWEVNTTDDTNDGDCEFFCSLRDAVMEANASTGDDLIVLPGGYYKLSLGGTGDDETYGDLDITDTDGKVTIAGPGIIDADGIDRVIEVHDDAELELRDLTITGGEAPSSGSWSGGGIYNEGTVTVIDTIITDNTTPVGGGGGGGIANWYGAVTVIDSTITNNNAATYGGGIRQFASGPVTVIDSTITNNNAIWGGGLYNSYGTWSGALINSHVTDNTAPVGPDCYGVVDTLGAVVVGDASDCTLTPVHVDHTTGESGGVEVLARLESDINPQLIFTNSGAAALEANGGEPIEWFHAMTSDGEFKISRNGTNTVEAKFFSSGDLVLAGALTQGSDVNEKTGIVPVDPVVVLERVRDLEVSSWSYAASPGVSHVGPMAQDFYASFGVGADPTGIAAVDADGVALAAIQALADENARLADDVQTLQLVLAVLILGRALVILQRWRIGRGQCLEPRVGLD